MTGERRQRLLWTAGAVILSSSALAYLALGGIGDDLVYYWTPTELADARERALGANVRLGGLVAPGSIERGSDGLDLRFEVTDGSETVPVHARTVPPAMFREGVGVVLDGKLATSGIFETRRLMIKHDNEYRPPGGADERSLDELLRSLQAGDGAG